MSNLPQSPAAERAREEAHQVGQGRRPREVELGQRQQDQPLGREQLRHQPARAAQGRHRGSRAAAGRAAAAAKQEDGLDQDRLLVVLVVVSAQDPQG